MSTDLLADSHAIRQDEPTTVRVSQQADRRRHRDRPDGVSCGLACRAGDLRRCYDPSNIHHFFPPHETKLLLSKRPRPRAMLTELDISRFLLRRLLGGASKAEVKKQTKMGKLVNRSRATRRRFSTSTSS